MMLYLLFQLIVLSLIMNVPCSSSFMSTTSTSYPASASSPSPSGALFTTKSGIPNQNDAQNVITNTSSTASSSTPESILNVTPASTVLKYNMFNESYYYKKYKNNNTNQGEKNRTSNLNHNNTFDILELSKLIEDKLKMIRNTELGVTVVQVNNRISFFLGVQINKLSSTQNIQMNIK